MKDTIATAVKNVVEDRYLEQEVSFTYKNSDTVRLDSNGTHVVKKVSVNFYNDLETGAPIYGIYLTLYPIRSGSIINICINDVENID